MSVSTSKATTGTTSEVSIKESLTTKVPTFTSTTIKPETSETQHSESKLLKFHIQKQRVLNYLQLIHKFLKLEAPSL